MFSFEIAKTPRIRPIPLKISATRKKIMITNIIVNIDIGLNIHPNTKNKINGRDIIISWDRKIPNRRLNLLNGPIIKAGKVFQYFSIRNCPGKIFIIPDKSIIL